MNPTPAFYELLPNPPHDIPDFASWHSLERSGNSRPLAPSFMLGDCPAILSRWYHSHIFGSDAGVFTIKDVAVTYRGFMRHQATPVACNYTAMDMPLYQRFLGEGIIRPEDTYRRIHAPAAALIFTMGYDVYGHWLVDFLPKLYILHLAGHDIHQLRYLAPTDLPAFGLEWLKLLGIQSSQLVPYDPANDLVCVDELLLPTMARQAHRALDIFAPSVEFLLDLLDRTNGRTPSPDGHERIFISRALAGRDGRTLANRSAIEDLARAQGYAIVHPERLPLLEQVAVFRGAREIIGEYGSGLHGSMFSDPGLQMCVLRGATYHPGFLQSGLCQSKGQSCGYVFGAAPIDRFDYEFSIDPVDFASALSLMAL